jgi:hypothetical protein
VKRHSRSAWFSLFLGLVLPLAIAVAPARAQQASSDDDAKIRPEEPDFTLVNLPTTLPLPVHGGDFHLTHRFNLDLTAGTFGDAASNLFGLDNGANVGLEFRFGVLRHLEAIVTRTSVGKTFQFSAKYDGWQQGGSRPVGISAIVSVEGQNNFKENYSPALGIVLSRAISDRLALYATPIWVHNTGTGGTGTSNTGFVGLGGRLRFLETTYVVAEVSPRLGGLVIGDPEYAFSLEKRVGGHVFALTFSDGAATTYREMANGGPGGLYLGFNLTRKFF